MDVVVTHALGMDQKIHFYVTEKVYVPPQIVVDVMMGILVQIVVNLYVVHTFSQIQMYAQVMVDVSLQKYVNATMGTMEVLAATLHALEMTVTLMENACHTTSVFVTMDIVVLTVQGKFATMTVVIEEHASVVVVSASMVTLAMHVNLLHVLG
jgi:hypothetical protein